MIFGTHSGRCKSCLKHEIDFSKFQRNHWFFVSYCQIMTRSCHSSTKWMLKYMHQTKSSPSHVETRVRLQIRVVVRIKILIKHQEVTSRLVLLWIAIFLTKQQQQPTHFFGNINRSVFFPRLRTDSLQQENVPQFGCLWATWLTFKWRKPLLLERENPTDCRRASNKGNRGCSGGLWKGTQCRYWRRSGLLSPTSTAKMNKLGPVRSLSNFLKHCLRYAAMWLADLKGLNGC